MSPELFLRSFLSSIRERPQRAFWTFAAVHLVLWTAVAFFTSPNAPLDVIEGYAWGHEWPLGTYKHPPMQAWILQILAILTNRAPWAHFLASQLAVVTAFWAVWQTGRRILDDSGALVGVLLLEGVIYYNFTSTEFNPNILSLPIWALIGLCFHRAAKDNRLTDWLLLGLWSAAGLYTKYSTVLLFAALALFMLANAKARRRFATPGPYVAIVTALLIFVPQLVWLGGHHFLPFTYATAQLSVPETRGFAIPKYILSPLFIISGQFIALLFFALLLLMLSGRRAADDKGADAFDRMFLRYVTFGPFLLTFVLSIFLGFRVHDMWAAPFWNFIGLWALARFRPALSPEPLMRFVLAFCMVFVTGLFTFGAANILYPYIENKTERIHFPGRRLAAEVTAGWHERTNAPLRYVIGDTWPAGNVAYYAPEWPHVFINGNETINPSISMADVDRDGAVLVWCTRHCLNAHGSTSDNVPDFVHGLFPRAQIQKPLTLPRLTGANVAPATIGWAILPPVKINP